MRRIGRMRTAVVACLMLAAGVDAAAECGEAAVQIRLNQTGFRLDGAKRAVIAAAATEPLRWQLVDRSDAVRAKGRTAVLGDDPASGEHLHLVDFSEFRSEGEEFRITSECSESHPRMNCAC